MQFFSCFELVATRPNVWYETRYITHLLSPDKVQRLVLVPNPPPGPTFIQQVPMVLCSMCPDGVLTVVAALYKVQHRHITYTMFLCTHHKIAITRLQWSYAVQNKQEQIQNRWWKGISKVLLEQMSLITSWRGNAASYELLLKRRLSPAHGNEKLEQDVRQHHYFLQNRNNYSLNMFLNSKLKGILLTLLVACTLWWLEISGNTKTVMKGNLIKPHNHGLLRLNKAATVALS